LQISFELQKMVKKFLNKLNFDEATQLIMESEELKAFITEDAFKAAKVNGLKLYKMAEDNKTT